MEAGKCIFPGGKCDKNEDELSAIMREIKENFKIYFVDRETLFKMLLEDHSSAMNGRIFDEENQIVVKNILKK